MHDLLRDFYAVLLYFWGESVTVENINQFQLEKFKEKLKQQQNNFDPEILEQIEDIIADVEYLSTMKILEKNPEKRSHYPHIVPISGLAQSSIVRLQSECRTVLEMWTRKENRSQSKPPSHAPPPTPPPASSEEQNKISGEDLSIVKQLEQVGINLNSLDDHDRTPLHVYCRPGGELGVKIFPFFS